MTTDERREFGRYLRRLRERRGDQLRLAAKACGLSDGYLARIEEGLANLPSSDRLMRLAGRYGVPVAEVLEKAGRESAIPEATAALERAKLDRAYQHVQVCRRYQSHSLYSGPLTDDIRRFCVEMYEQGTGRHPLGCDCGAG